MLNTFNFYEKLLNATLLSLYGGETDMADNSIMQQALLGRHYLRERGKGVYNGRVSVL